MLAVGPQGRPQLVAGVGAHDETGDDLGRSACRDACAPVKTRHGKVILRARQCLVSAIAHIEGATPTPHSGGGTLLVVMIHFVDLDGFWRLAGQGSDDCEVINS